MGFFDLFSGKDDTPPAPEERIIPVWAENIKSPLEGWITTQVFVDKKNKSRRIYYAARLDGDTWNIIKYSYSVTALPGKCAPERMGGYKDGSGLAIRLIGNLEGCLLEDGYAPVANLKGNYREAANLNGAYFDDKGKYTPVTKDDPIITKEALLDRKGIQAIYSKAAEKPAEPTIKTWDDFYREIVRNSSQEEIVLSDQAKQDSNFPKVMEYISNTLVLMHALENKMMSEKERLQMEKSVSPVSGDYFSKLAAKINWGSTETVYDEDGGTPRIVYDYEAARLTIMMRAGSQLYQKLMASAISIDADALNLLSHIGETISTFAEERLNCSPEQAKQLANVIMQGPDPYADKPLPLEVFFDQYKDQLPPASKTKPKNPGL